MQNTDHSTGTTRNLIENKQVITHETAMVGVGGKEGGSERDVDKYILKHVFFRLLKT